jgi:hypothetical protein
MSRVVAPGAGDRACRSDRRRMLSATTVALAAAATLSYRRLALAQSTSHDRPFDRQRDRWHDRGTDRPPDRLADRLADQPSGRLTERPPEGQPDRQPERTSTIGSVERPARAHTALPQASDLSPRPGTRHLVLFSVTGCPYCEIVRSRHLRFRVGSRLGQNSIAVSEVMIDQDHPVVGFDGTATTHRALAAGLGIRFAPTVIAVDGAGRRIGEPLVGALLDDFYGAYLDQLLDQATAN